MSRVALSEFCAKKLLVGHHYEGVSVSTGEPQRHYSEGRYVVKVDQGVKKRHKKGLLFLNVPSNEVPSRIRNLEEKGFSHFLVEPYHEHTLESERYISLERVRDGVRVLYVKHGGVEIESNSEAAMSWIISDDTSVQAVIEATEVPARFLEKLLEVFNANHFCFLEINPFFVRDDIVYLLDAAVLVDDAAAFCVTGWNESDLVSNSESESTPSAIIALQARSTASFNLTVLNPNGAIFCLLSGGGGSLVVADALAAEHSQSMGNYGEYSGGPTREETYHYAREIITLMLASNAKRKALIIAGAIANFTNVAETFSGIIDALREVVPSLQRASVRIYVRRGGPGEAEGIALMRDYLEREGLVGVVYGSDVPLTQVARDALEYIEL